MSVCPTLMKPNPADFLNQIWNLLIQIRRVEIFSTVIWHEFDKLSNFYKFISTKFRILSTNVDLCHKNHLIALKQASKVMVWLWFSHLNLDLIWMMWCLIDGLKRLVVKNLHDFSELVFHGTVTSQEESKLQTHTCYKILSKCSSVLHTDARCHKIKYFPIFVTRVTGHANLTFSTL